MTAFSAAQFYTAIIAILGVLVLPGDVSDATVINFFFGYGATALVLAILSARSEALR